MDWAEAKAMVAACEEAKQWVELNKASPNHFEYCSRALENLDAAKKLEESAFTNMMSHFIVDNFEAAIKLNKLRKEN